MIMQIQSIALLVLIGLMILLGIKRHKDFLLTIIIAAVIYNAVQTYGIQNILEEYYNFTMRKVEFVNQGASKTVDKFFDAIRAR